MLMNLIPGVRDLRSPLAAGYVWVAVIWLAWGRHLPDGTHSTGLLREVQKLAKSAGTPATAAAISFSAYLVGVLSVACSDSLVRLPVNFSDGFGVKLLNFRPTRPLGRRLLNANSKVNRTLKRAVSDRLKEMHVAHFVTNVVTNNEGPDEFTSELRSRMRHPSAGGTVLYDIAASGKEFVEHDRATQEVLKQEVRTAVIDKLLHDIIDDLPLVPARLLGRDSDLYDVYDRLRAESQFRAAVALPLVIFGIVLAVVAGSPLYLGILPLALVLFLTGYQRQREAEYVLVESIYARRVDTPVLEILSRVSEESAAASVGSEEAE